MLDTFNSFHCHERFCKELNRNFITLIPKREGAEEIKDFRSISLVSSVYKLISKVLTARIKKVIPTLIDENQMAFINKRQALDNAFIANETIAARISSNKPGIVIKLDMEKAFDRYNWNFIGNILRRFNFHEKFINWIEFCISTPNASVLVNGKQTTWFKPMHVLRQGDPMSPYIFILVMQVLSSLITKGREIGLMDAFTVGQGDYICNVSHLLFADDCMVFCGTDVKSVLNLRIILDLFQQLTGLKINLEKSSMFPIGNVENIHIL